MLVPLKWIALVLLAILPVLQIPNWCIKEDFYTPKIHTGQCNPEEYPNSEIFYILPNEMTALLIICYTCLTTFIVMRLFIKKRDKGSIFRSTVMLGMIFTSTIDLLWVFVFENRSATVVTDIFNVFLLLFFVRSIREVWIQFIQVMINSVPVFAIIMAYFVVFVLIGFILFANSQVSESFITINESMYTVYILFTVSNYPDVAMPFFEEYRMFMFYFWSYLLIGIFLLSNLLLAQIFLNYKKLLTRNVTMYESKVQEYFLQLFRGIAEDKNNTNPLEAILNREEEERKFISTEELTEAMGGKEVVAKDKRLNDLIWQCNLLLDNKIHFQDFVYIVQFTDTFEQQDS